MAFDKIPVELQQLNQWVNWRYENVLDANGKPELDQYGNLKRTKIPLRSIDGKKASCTDPRDWSDFGTAISACAFCDGLGFVFSSGDPFCGIDFDNKADDAAIALALREQALSYQSYAEFSPSLKGIHVICKARLPGKGRRRGNLEIYDNARFFTFTGNSLNDAPIIDCQAKVLEAWQSIGPLLDTVETRSAGAENESFTDEEILAKAEAASNGEKFKRLFSGDWQTDYGEKSQSEADFALINIIGFYSRNITQTVRIFRLSGLGQRAKAQRGSYVSLMARRAFDRMAPTVTMLPGAQWFDATLVEPWPQAGTPVQALPAAPPAASEHSVALPAVPGIPAIPGLVGALMSHCWHRSTYPVPEVAVASALASMAVLAGRTYHFNGRGLSLYILLLAKTSIGKSFAYQAQHAWANALSKRYSDPTGGQQYKMRAEFLEGMITGKIGSGPGIAQHVVRHPNTICQYDEFVKVMKRIGHPYANVNDIAIQEELLSLTDASQPGSIYREKRYSDRSMSGNKAKLPPVISPSFSLLGTGTPEEFYDDLNNGILEGGFLPRFTILEYDGTLPEENAHVIHDIDRAMMDQITFHFNKAFELNAVINGDMSQIQNVAANPQAQADLDRWKRHCETAVRTAHTEGVPMAGIWSRAMMHVNQVAALIAIGVNPHFPTITAEHVGIARGLIEPGIMRLAIKLGANETGTGDSRCEAEIRQFVTRIRREGYTFVKSFSGLNQEIVATQYVQVSLIKWHCVKLSAFRRNKTGENRAFDDVINAMVNAGEFERKEFVNASGRKVKALLPTF